MFIDGSKDASKNVLIQKMATAQTRYEIYYFVMKNHYYIL